MQAIKDTISGVIFLVLSAFLSFCMFAGFDFGIGKWRVFVIPLSLVFSTLSLIEAYRAKMEDHSNASVRLVVFLFNLPIIVYQLLALVAIFYFWDTVWYGL